MAQHVRNGSVCPTCGSPSPDLYPKVGAFGWKKCDDEFHSLALPTEVEQHTGPRRIRGYQCENCKSLVLDPDAHADRCRWTCSTAPLP